MTRFLADCAIVLAIVCVLAFYEGLIARERAQTHRVYQQAAVYAEVIAACANGQGFVIGTTTRVRCAPREVSPQ